MKICYLGTNYFGFQIQTDKTTIQGVIENTFFNIFKKKIKIIGCSRTDAGVHAKEFYLNFHIDDFNIPCFSLQNALNTYLPYDIRILDVYLASPSFHSRYDARGKEYEYKILNSKIIDPFRYNEYMHFRYNLDFESMKEASLYFVGEHDFRAFMSNNTGVKSTIRTIYKSNIYKYEDVIVYNILGNGFLYNMVRIIVGTLIMVGQGKITPSNIPGIILSKDRKNAGFVSDAKGLCLKKVLYDN